MQLKATIKKIGITEVVSDKFKKRDIVLTDNSNEKYPQHILFQLIQDKVNLADKVKIGDSVEISFNLKGREYTNSSGEVKYFNSLEIYSVTKLNSAVESTEPSHIADTNDDVPF